MDIERRRSGVRSIPDKTSTGTRRPVRRTLGAVGRAEGSKPVEHQVKGQRKKSSPPPPPKVGIEKTKKGKRWLSPGEVELHGDVLEVRDEHGKIVDSVLIPLKEDKA